MKSIIQKDDTTCFLCGANANLEPLDRHHVFGGPLRDISEHYGLTVYLHHCKCHIFGKKSVHVDNKQAEKLKAYVQKKAMEYYGWSVEEFKDIFGKSYI